MLGAQTLHSCYSLWELLCTELSTHRASPCGGDTTCTTLHPSTLKGHPQKGLPPSFGSLVHLHSPALGLAAGSKVSQAVGPIRKHG